MHTRSHTYANAYVHHYIRTHIYIYIGVRACACACACVRACVYVCVRVCACARVRVVCVCAHMRLCPCVVRVYPSKRIHVAACGPIGTKFDTLMQIHLERVVTQRKIAMCDLGGIFGGGGLGVKHLENLPNGWTDRHQSRHICSDLSGNGHKVTKLTLETPG